MSTMNLHCRLAIKSSLSRKKKIHDRRWLVALLFMAILVPTPAKTQEIRHVRVSLSLGAGQLGLWVTREAGLFAKNGLDVELVGLQSAARQIQLLLSRETLFASTSGTAPITARIEGADTVFIMGVLNTFTLSIVAVPEIQGPGDLKGKVLGVGSLGSSPEALSKKWLKKWGLERDVKILPTGGYVEGLAAMEHRRIQAAVLDPPRAYVGRKKFGYRELANLGEDAKYATTATITTANTIRREHDLVFKFVKAYVEGIHRVKTQKEFAVMVLGKNLRSRDREILEETYRVFSSLFEKVPYPTLEGIQTVLEEIGTQNPKAKNFRPEDFVDMSLVRQLDQSGFIKALYR